MRKVLVFAAAVLALNWANVCFAQYGDISDLKLLRPADKEDAKTVPPPKDAIVPGALVTGKVERHEKFGVFVFLAPGRTGLIPMAETGVDRDADLLKMFPIGGEVEVVVLEMDPSSRRIRLSRKAVAEQRELAELREYSARADTAPTTSVGSLADSLRDALKGRS